MFDNEIRLQPERIKPVASKELAWCFPNSYNIGMSGLGYQLVFELLDRESDLSVRRVFLDVEEPVSSDCRLFGFTMSWELDFINLLAMLKAHGIPLLSRDRGDDDALVFGGGPVLTANPEPYAEIFDVILLGDAEETIPSFVSGLRTAEKNRRRSDKLIALANSSGIYVPSLYSFEYEQANGSLDRSGKVNAKKESSSECSKSSFAGGSPASTGNAIRAVRCKSSDVPERVSKLLFRAPADYVAHSTILASDTTWGDIFLLELARSCPQECRFCLASYLTRPFRTAEVDTVLAKVDLALPHTKKIGLMGPSITEHPGFEAIIDGLLARSSRTDPLNVSVASVRADTLTAGLTSKLRALGQKSVTIALESGSERLRRIMKKNLSEQEVMSAVSAIEDGGMNGVKFYLIAGLPYEEWHDLEETVRLLKCIKKEHKRLKLVAGISSFVPKAQTPFQWKGRDRKSKEKIEFLRKNLAALGIEVRPESHNWSDIQALLSRGDRRLTEVLLDVAARGETLGAWKQALKQRDAAVPSLEFYAHRDIPENEVLPWSHICVSEKNAYINKQSIEARNEANRVQQKY